MTSQLTRPPQYDSRPLVMRSVIALALAVLAACSIGGARDDPSFTVTFGPEVLASVNDQDGGALRCEPSVAIHGENLVVAWNDSHGGIHGARTGVVVGWSYSTDGGRTFHFGGYAPSPDPEQALGSADARLTTDATGNFYLAVLVWRAGAHEVRTFFMHGDKMGTWHERSQPIGTTGKPLLDKPDLVAWGENNLALACTRGEHIAVTISRDGGHTWSEPTDVSRSDNGRRTGVAIRAVGSTIVAAWMEGNGMSLTELWLAASTDGGRTFEPPRRVFKWAGNVEPLDGYAMGVGPAAVMNSDAALALEPSGDDLGMLHVAGLEGFGAGSRIRLLATDLDSLEGDRAIVLGNAPSETGKAFISLALAGDVPAVLYYDRRHAENTTRTDVYLTLRAADGTSHDYRVNTAPTDWLATPGDAEHAPIQRNFGDYITLATHGRQAVAAWTSGRSGQPRIHVRSLTIEPH